MRYPFFLFGSTLLLLSFAFVQGRVFDDSLRRLEGQPTINPSEAPSPTPTSSPAPSIGPSFEPTRSRAPSGAPSKSLAASAAPSTEAEKSEGCERFICCNWFN